jgi:threonylcarbamoyladenosine tRNA methylthiotransferase MtaB
MQKKAFEQNLLGEKVDILLEEEVMIGDASYFTGHTMNYVKVGVKGNELGSNQIVCAKIEGFSEKDFLIAQSL